eukprot:361182-Chlamydomonas_euryale.AAC.5
MVACQHDCLPVWLLASLIIGQPAGLPARLHAGLTACLSGCLPVWSPAGTIGHRPAGPSAGPLACRSACHPTCPSAGLITCRPACPSSCLPTGPARSRPPVQRAAWQGLEHVGRGDGRQARGAGRHGVRRVALAAAPHGRSVRRAGIARAHAWRKARGRRPLAAHARPHDGAGVAHASQAADCGRPVGGQRAAAGVCAVAHRHHAARAAAHHCGRCRGALAQPRAHRLPAHVARKRGGPG